MLRMRWLLLLVLAMVVVPGCKGPCPFCALSSLRAVVALPKVPLGSRTYKTKAAWLFGQAADRIYTVCDALLRSFFTGPKDPPRRGTMSGFHPLRHREREQAPGQEQEQEPQQDREQEQEPGRKSRCPRSVGSEQAATEPETLEPREQGQPQGPCDHSHIHSRSWGDSSSGSRSWGRSRNHRRWLRRIRHRPTPRCSDPDPGNRRQQSG